MKIALSALLVLTAPATVMAYGPSATGSAQTSATTEAVITWKGTLNGVTAQNKSQIESAIKKIAGVEKVTLTEAGAAEIIGKSFTEAQVASSLPTGVSIQR